MRRNMVVGRLVTAAVVLALLGGAACDAEAPTDNKAPEDVSVTRAALTLAPQLDRNTVPKFANELERFFTFAPTLTRNAQGQVIRKDFTVRMAKFQAQQLPTGFPSTLLFGYGGDVFTRTGPNGEDLATFDQRGTVKFKRTSPGPKFEQTRLIPDTTRYRNELAGEHPLAVDPTLEWANPNNFPKPLPPFLPFPPGYAEAQSPITHTTHTHGLEVLPHFDGTPDTWFTPTGVVGPEFVSNDYQRPNSNGPAAYWYHDHSFGVTRLDVGMGLSGYAMLRDPAANPLDFDGNADILGMEDPNDWSAPTLNLGISTTRTQGRFSTSFTAQNFNVLRSRAFDLTAPIGANLALDFFIPSQQPNPSFFGAVQMYVDCPSKGVNNAFVGQVELTGRPTNTFSRLTFPVSAAIRNSVGSSCGDFNVRVAVNVPFNATGTYRIDNIGGVVITPTSPLPAGEFEVPLIVQDRSFRTDGSVFYPIAQEQPPGTIGANPDVNPYWLLIQNGDMNVVNGKVWPNMNVKRHAYRFRILNSANQRFYTFSLSNGMPMRIIGTDGGFLNAPRDVTSFHIGVTERVDFIVDFSQVPVGTQIIMRNTGQLQPPIGPQPDPNNDGLVMRFTVVNSPAVPPKPLPATLNNIATLTPNRPTRILIQNVQSDDEGRILQAELDGQLFHELTTELPTVGATEDWDFVNTTPLDHNKHVHLIQFLVVERRTFDDVRYLADWIAANGNPPFDHPTLKLPLEPYFTGPPMGPAAWESGWKDTVQTPAHQVTRIRIRWAPQTLPTGTPAIGANTFPFDPTFGIGFIWHCHLLEHEDNEMMRPMTVVPIWRSGVAYPVGFRGSPGVNRGVVDFQGVDYQARVAHTSTNQTPNQRFDLWERINNENGDWAVQIIYQVGDRVFFQGHVWRALQAHQAVAGTEPATSPAFWQLVL